MQLTVNIQKQLPSYCLEVSFTADGETLGILGSSGAGKSMTLRCIAGIETPTSGTIALNGRVLYDSRQGIDLPSRDRRVGVLFQSYALFPHLTVAQNIAYGLKGWSRSAAQRRVAEQLDQVKLSALGDRYPSQLSGGQQQRVALARALAPDPDILLLDEPFSALDTHLRSELERQLIKTLSSYRGLTLLVSHNLEEAYRICQTLVVLSEGKIVADGAKQDLFDYPGSLTVAQLTGCKNYATIQPLADQTIRALDWHCTLKTAESVLPSHTHVGMRAHHITFLDRPGNTNSWPAWLAWASETPHRMTLYLKLGEPPADADDYHLQAEVFKEKWMQLKDRPMPWLVHLDPQKLLLLNSSAPTI